eukprot:jgi/Mesvir1/12364/Mv00547-RA.1
MNLLRNAASARKRSVESGYLVVGEGSDAGTLLPGRSPQMMQRYQGVLLEAVRHTGDENTLWDAAFRLVDMAKQGNAEDLASAFKPLIKSPNSGIAVRALLVLDVCVNNCSKDFQAQLATKKWQTRFAKICVAGDSRVMQLMLQLLANWRNAYAGEPLGEAIGTTAEKQLFGMTLPPPAEDAASSFLASATTTEAEAHSAMAVLERQMAAAAVMAANSSQHAQHHHNGVAGVSSSTGPAPSGSVDADAIRADVGRLKAAVNAMQPVIQSGANADSAPELFAEGTHAASACKRWLDVIHNYLLQETSEEVLMVLLEVNDDVNVALERWNGLAAMRPTEQRDLFAGAGNWLDYNSGGGNETIAALQRELQALQREASAALEEYKRRSATSAAAHEAEIARVKHMAVARIKELTSQVHELEERSARLEAEAGRLRSTADHSEVLAAAAQESQKVETSLRDEIRQLKAKMGAMEVEMLERDEHLAAARSRAQLLQERVNQSQEMADKFEAQEKRIQSLSLEVKKESILRKKLYNQVRELKGNIRVLVRVRPLLPHEVPKNPPVAVSKVDEYTVEVMLGTQERGRTGGEATAKRFEYDAIFDGGATQADVFAETEALIQSVFDGYNVCIFCYGQTGSGKTHTILGNEAEPGILPRAMSCVYKARETANVAVQCYMLELYQDNLMDLLSPDKNPAFSEKLEIKRDASGNVRVDGLTTRACAEEADLRGALQHGLSLRKTSSTKMNVQSSRSHLVFGIIVEFTNRVTGTTTRGKLTFVDLAGSERVAKSGALENDVQLKEATAINKSLSALGDVVAALTSEAQFVPYRNHKLTQLMSDSIGGNAKTLMIANASPLASDDFETKSTMEYAARVKQVTNQTSRSVETKETARLKAVIEKQNQEIARLKGGAAAK